MRKILPILFMLAMVYLFAALLPSKDKPLPRDRLVPPAPINEYDMILGLPLATDGRLGPADPNKAKRVYVGKMRDWMRRYPGAYRQWKQENPGLYARYRADIEPNDAGPASH
jgi:hypothetical protein